RAQVVVPQGEQVEGDEARGRLRREQRNARRGGMNPLQQRIEIEASRPRDDDLPVHHAALGQRLPQGLHQLRKVALQRLPIAAFKLERVVLAKNHRSKTVPFGLITPLAASRDLLLQLREHWPNRHLNRQSHLYKKETARLPKSGRKRER